MNRVIRMHSSICHNWLGDYTLLERSSMDRLIKLMPMLGVGVLLVLGVAAFARGASTSGPSPEPATVAPVAADEPTATSSLPAIDLAAPTEFETATFGMG